MRLSKKKFLIILGLWGVCVPAALIGFNYRMDPGGRYHMAVSDADLTVLAGSSSHRLIVPENYDDRALLARYIRVIPRPSIVLMGGSRVLNIADSMLRTGEHEYFLNSGMTSGTYRDYVEIWRQLKRSDKVPNKVVLCLDQQGMGSLSQNDLWRSLVYSRRAIWAELKDLTAYQTTLRSFNMFGRGRGRFEMIGADRLVLDKPVRGRDLSLRYPTAYENRDEQEVLKAGRSNGDGETKAFHAWSEDDIASFVALKEVVGDMKSSGVEAYIILMPYHPEALNRLLADPVAGKKMRSFRDRVARMAKESQVPFYDGYEDGRTHLSNADFADGVHLKTSSNQAFFKRADQALGIGIFE